MHTTKLLENLGVIVVRYDGRVDYSEIRHVFDELVQLPGFRSGLGLVADCRTCETPITGAEVRRLADYAEQTDDAWGNSKWIILASSDVIFGLARMYAALTSTYKVTTHVFRDAKEADDWLGIGVTLSQVLET